MSTEGGRGRGAAAAAAAAPVAGAETPLQPLGRRRWGRERCGEERVGEWGCYGLIVAPIPHPLHCLSGERSQEWRREVKPGKGGCRGGGKCFCFSPSNCMSIGNKLIFTSQVSFARDSDW